MSFLNVTFPELELKHDMQRSRDNNTVVFGNGNKEFRLRRHSQDPYTWAWPGRNISQTDARTLQAFYDSVQGGLYSFKYKDPDDYQWDDLTLVWYDTNRWRVKSNTGSPIYHGTITDVKLNSVSQGSATITIVDETPLITVSGSSSGSTVEITGSFFYAARFASVISTSLAAFNDSNTTEVVSLDSFSLREVKEYA